MRFKYTLPLLLIIGHAAFADSAQTVIEHVQMQKNTSSNTKVSHALYQQLTKEKQHAIASQWNISELDYSRYLKLMEETPAGVYYGDKNLDPTWVLAIEAENDKDFQKFTRLAIQNERKQLTKELKFSNAFSTLQQQMYPNEKPFKYKSPQPVATFQSGDSFLFFTQLNTSENQPLVAKLLALLEQNSEATLQIYITDNVKDEAIFAWAAAQHIPTDLVKQHRIGLNHDKGLFAKLTQGKGVLPLLILNRGGDWQALDSSLLR